jgi:hypothetical protein
MSALNDDEKLILDNKRLKVRYLLDLCKQNNELYPTHREEIDKLLQDIEDKNPSLNRNSSSTNSTPQFNPNNHFMTPFLSLRRDADYGNWQPVNTNSTSGAWTQVLSAVIGGVTQAAAEQIVQEDVPVPLPQEHLEKLEVNEYKDLETDEVNCSICLENYKEDTKVIQLPCNHIFCEKCIKKHFETKCFCSICQKDMRECFQSESN